MTSPPPQTQSPAPVPRPAPLVQKAPQQQPSEPVLCNHCGRTASNGISCQGYCVADSDY
ncbi:MULTISPECIES: hypothetical protein [unclassified Synechococcus]|uniref:hypothetical protein n=1 Tax=unclassified Synechococcus TaxID=2626047 RepID=UPI0002DB0940|nr:MULTISPECIES: hypothetical protein [unclassified Synechococcus]WFN59074.1 hypothetical protein N4320_00055 [Synechococcus sp. CCFWC 502]CAK6693372.1 hypothetical protein ICNINCKA_01405 [Synechococcus sp. CBW1107]